MESPGPTNRETAYVRIRDDILTGHLMPGALISEADRAEELGMSRSPVREALRQLAQDGLVQIYPKRGTFVTELSPRDVREAYELRDAIEPACARLAAERWNDDDLRAMEEACASIDRQAHDEKRAYEEAARFHGLVVAATRNRYMIEVFESSQAKINLASRAAAAAAGPRAARDIHHREILAAIAARDGELGESLMRKHLRDSAQRLIARML